MVEIKDRINIIMEKENMKPGAFAESIGIQQPTLSHILNGRNNPSLDVVMKVHQRYNYISLEWLLYGIGEMVEEKKGAFAKDFSPSLFDQKEINPYQNPSDAKYRKETAFEKPEKDIKPAVIQEIKYIEKPSRKITEIRIFFDDNTYEIFKAEK